MPGYNSFNHQDPRIDYDREDDPERFLSAPEGRNSNTGTQPKGVTE